MKLESKQTTIDAVKSFLLGLGVSAVGIAEDCFSGSDCTSTQLHRPTPEAPNPTQSVEFAVNRPTSSRGGIVV
jgi:hypothetical protein